MRSKQSSDMITNAPLPPELQNAISGENVDFILRSSRLRPLREALYFLFFSLFWLAISLTVGAGFFLPLIFFGTVDIEINDVPTTVTQDNLDVMILPAVFIGVFVLIGLGVLSYAIYAFFARGGWYIGLPTGISYYRKKKTEFMKWDTFSSVETKGGDDRGEVILNLQNGSEIHMTKVPEPKKLAEICEQRIKGQTAVREG